VRAPSLLIKSPAESGRRGGGRRERWVEEGGEGTEERRSNLG